MSVKLRKKQLSNGRVHLWLDIYAGHTRHAEFLGFYLTGDKTTDKIVLQKAKEIQSQRQMEVSFGRYGISTEFRKDFWRYAEDFYKEKNPSNQKAFEHMILHFKKFCTEVGIDISRYEQLTPNICTKFGAYLQQHLRPNSVALYYSKLRSIGHSLIRDGILKQNPCPVIKLPASAEPTRYLTFEEVQKLANAPCKHIQVKNGFLFCCFVGLRIGDLLRLEWSSVQDGKIRIIQQKTNKLVEIPLSKTAQSILEQQIGLNPHNPHVFVYPTHNIIRQTLRDWSIAAGLDRTLTHHMSRHSFAVLCLNNGIELHVVSELLGHKKLATTSHYAKLLDSTKSLAIQKLPNL